MDKNSRDELLHLQLWDLEEKEANGMHLLSYPCPCKMCMGGMIQSRENIRKHLRQYKRDPQFRISILERVCIPKTSLKVVQQENRKSVFCILDYP